MLKSCQYCGKIHDKSFDCGKKPKKIVYRKKNTDEESEAQDIRKRSRWTMKSLYIRQRDSYLCQCCIHNIYPLFFKKDLDDRVEVHHIVPIREDKTLAYNDYNLITLCVEHHKAADDGLIDRDDLLKIAKENTDKFL